MSVDSAGLQANGSSSVYRGSLSVGGRFVAFASRATNLVAGDTNAHTDCFLRDLQLGTTVRVSLGPGGVQGNGDSFLPAVSADGRYVAFASDASNLVAGDSNLVEDIFVRDLQTGTTELVSLSSGGVQGGGQYPSISGDGRHVAFVSRSAVLVPGDTNGAADVFVRDRQAGTTTRVSVTSGGAQSDGDAVEAMISGDGRFVAFDSPATNLVVGDTNRKDDVYVHDRQTGTTELASVGLFGMPGDGPSLPPKISGNGRYVVFHSFATNLVFGDANGRADTFLRDRLAGTTTRVSVDSLGGEGDGHSYSPSVSDDGRFVAFYSLATDLVAGDTNATEDVFVHDLLSGETERVSVDSLGAQATDRSFAPEISGDGRLIVYHSYAADLVAGDTNAALDVFVRDRCGLAVAAATFAGDGLNADAIQPVDTVLGSAWSAPLILGHTHGAGGALTLTVRTATLNGANFTSPFGGRPAEVLVGGALLATLAGVHDGVSGDVPTQTIPNRFALVGVSWAAQYTVAGGGFVDLSRAVFGRVGCP